MTDELNDVTAEAPVVETKSKRLIFATQSYFGINTGGGNNLWSPEDIDKYDFSNIPTTTKDYYKAIDACRFFYRKDPLASTVINKLVDIGITDLEFTKGNLSDNEYKIFTSMEDELKEFAECMAMEFLVSGLVFPEIKYASVTTDKLKEWGIKKYPTLIMPVSMWLRDPSTIKINQVLSDKPSYYVKIPDDMVYFIMNNGRYPDGTKDLSLFEQLKAYYPEFVSEVQAGAKEILTENNLVIRRKPLSDSPYPTPYLYSALESLKHKRNLRRMDYSISARVIGAIQLIQLGSDEYPLTEDDSDKVQSIRDQMYWRNTNGRDIERIFQLFADHTLKITWVMPDVTALLDDKKYLSVNQDIIFALGFPRILITGESERTGTSDPQYATMSPVKTMNNFREKIVKVLQSIVTEVATQNKLRSTPEIYFRELQLSEFATFVNGVTKLYDSGNLSRESFAEIFGYEWEDEANKKAEENKLMATLGLETSAPLPFSPQPQKAGNTQDNTKPPQNQNTGG